MKVCNACGAMTPSAYPSCEKCQKTEFTPYKGKLTVGQKISDLLGYALMAFGAIAAVGGVMYVLAQGIKFVTWKYSLAPEARGPEYSFFNREAIYGACAQFVTATLETPATAKFPGDSEKDTTIKTSVVEQQELYQVWSYVDAQNKFGAVVRTRFLCHMFWNQQTKKWISLGIDTAPWNEPERLSPPAGASR